MRRRLPHVARDFESAAAVLSAVATTIASATAAPRRGGPCCGRIIMSLPPLPAYPGELFVAGLGRLLLRERRRRCRT
jgi:hypothetical protein